MEVTYAEWSPKLGSRTDEAVCTKNDEDVDFDYKQRAMDFWRSGTRKSNRELSAVQHRFRRVTSVCQLRRWAGQVNKGGAYMEKLHRIADQGEFHLEMHSGRTLAIEGTRQVECVVQSISSTTHSCTIQPTISADG